MPKKVLEGHEEDIRPCVACNLCLARLFRDAPMTCYVNPVCAHEWDPEWQIRQTDMDKKVMIIGGGPAGLECAWTAAARGHEVHLFDDKEVPGGQIVYASKAPYGDEELYGMIDFLVAQCKKTGVEMHLGIKVTPEMIDEEMPDAVILATGARFRPEEVPGFDRENVVSALDVLEGNVEVGDNIVVWGGKKPGIAAALHLAKEGKKVTLVSHERKVGKDVNPSYVWRYIKKLKDLRVTTYRDAEREPISDLKAKVTELGLEVHVLGDALVPRALSNALHDGYRTGIRI
jgi:2,4-dienoyl-CoA reductase (NADPH2)